MWQVPTVLIAVVAAFFFVRWCRRRAAARHARKPDGLKSRKASASASRSRAKPAARKSKGRER